jgi:hypothetical protein
MDRCLQLFHSHKLISKKIIQLFVVVYKESSFYEVILCPDNYIKRRGMNIVVKSDDRICTGPRVQVATYLQKKKEEYKLQ